MKNFVVALVLLVNVVIYAKCARILVVVPTPSISHQVVFRAFTQELAKRGHEITVVTTDPAFPKGQSPANLTEIDVHDVSYKIWEKAYLATATGEKRNLINQLTGSFTAISTIIEIQLQNPEFQKILRDGRKFDLLILEAWTRPILALSHVFKAPVILMSSFGRVFYNYEVMGVPTHPLLYPACTNQRLYNLNLWEKIEELYYNHFKMNLMLMQREKEYNEMIKRVFGPDTPSLDELSNNVDMLFLNIHPVFEGNYPVPPGVQHLWGIHKHPAQEISKVDEELKDYLDSSKHGVIYMSFGTNVDPKLLPKEKIQMFVKVFSELPYDVLWKWNEDVLPGKPNNVKISKWFPQAELLRHPKVKLFITQGGLQSTDETIRAGVPVLGVPMIGDQWYNVEKYMHLGIGEGLDFETITESKIKEAITKVIDNESYRRNVAKLDRIMRDEPMDGLQRAVWWTEYVLRHSGARHLRSPAANISWAQYLELPLIAVVLSFLLAVIFVIVTISKFVFRLLGVSQKRKVD